MFFFPFQLMFFARISKVSWKKKSFKCLCVMDEEPAANTTENKHHGSLSNETRQVWGYTCQKDIMLNVLSWLYLSVIYISIISRWLRESFWSPKTQNAVDTSYATVANSRWVNWWCLHGTDARERRSSVVTHLRSDDAWRTRWAGLALEPLWDPDTKQNCHRTDAK